MRHRCYEQYLCVYISRDRRWSTVNSWDVELKTDILVSGGICIWSGSWSGRLSLLACPSLFVFSLQKWNKYRLTNHFLFYDLATSRLASLRVIYNILVISVRPFCTPVILKRGLCACCDLCDRLKLVSALLCQRCALRTHPTDGIFGFGLEMSVYLDDDDANPCDHSGKYSVLCVCVFLNSSSIYSAVRFLTKTLCNCTSSVCVYIILEDFILFILLLLYYNTNKNCVLFALPRYTIKRNKHTYNIMGVRVWYPNCGESVVSRVRVQYDNQPSL